jgi:hypothetical protein
VGAVEKKGQGRRRGELATEAERGTSDGPMHTSKRDGRWRCWARVGEKMGRGAWRWERRALGVGYSASVRVVGAEVVGPTVVSMRKRNMARRSARASALTTGRRTRATGPHDAQRGSGPQAGHGAGWATSAPGAMRSALGAEAAGQVCVSCQGRARERRRLGARARANAGELGRGIGRGGTLHGLWLGALERGGPGEGERRDGPFPFLSYFLYLLFFSILSTNSNRIH